MKITILMFACFLFSTKSNSQVIQVTDQQLFNAFKQGIVQFEGTFAKLGGGGNFASIALVKAAIGTFGINGVFSNVVIDSANEMITVTERSGTVLKLSFDRLGNGEESFYIKREQDDSISKKIISYAKFCFAVMARAEQLKLGYDQKYFYRGVDKLNKGQLAEQIYQLLGVQNSPISDLSFENLAKFKNVVVYIAPHAVYSSSGYYDEGFDNVSPTGIETLSRLSQIHCNIQCPILGAYTLK